MASRFFCLHGNMIEDGEGVYVCETCERERLEARIVDLEKSDSVLDRIATVLEKIEAKMPSWNNPLLIRKGPYEDEVFGPAVDAALSTARGEGGE